jgi:hypothetical protein
MLVDVSGWRVRKRTRDALAAPLGSLAFTVENPLESKLRQLPAMQRLLATEAVRLWPTSYCHFGAGHRKRTFVVSNVPALGLHPPCPTPPCAPARRGPHPVSVRGDLSRAEKNALPERLVAALAVAWEGATPWARHRVVVDVFSGFGSVGKALEKSRPSWTVLANDVVRRDHLDLLVDAGGRRDQLHLLVVLGVLKARRANAHLDAAWRALPTGTELAPALHACQLAVWIHLSTPCETYSVLGGDLHRSKGSLAPKTAKADRHDRMNAALFEWLALVACPGRTDAAPHGAGGQARQERVHPGRPPESASP